MDHEKTINTPIQQLNTSLSRAKEIYLLLRNLWKVKKTPNQPL
jgi:hypothetical protein